MAADTHGSRKAGSILVKLPENRDTSYEYSHDVNQTTKLTTICLITAIQSLGQNPTGRGQRNDGETPPRDPSISPSPSIISPARTKCLVRRDPVHIGIRQSHDDLTFSSVVGLLCPLDESSYSSGYASHTSGEDRRRGARNSSSVIPARCRLVMTCAKCGRSRWRSTSANAWVG